MRKRTTPRSLQELVESQFLILSYLQSKLDTINYISSGYYENKPILKNNRFLIYVGHILQKSLIIDFATLFDTSPNQVNNFHLLYQQEYKNELTAEVFESIRTILSKYRTSKEPVKSIINLRNTQVAHYDPLGSDKQGKLSIQLNWDFLDEMNELNNVGKKIIAIMSKSLGTGYIFPKHNKLKRLDKMVEILASYESRL
ncbi:MAG: hypothetical protein ACK4EY_12765 [Flavipsychrobacter sp.]